MPQYVPQYVMGLRAQREAAAQAKWSQRWAERAQAIQAPRPSAQTSGEEPAQLPQAHPLPQALPLPQAHPWALLLRKEVAQLAKPRRILDAGCGLGAGLAAWVGLWDDSYGVDRASQAIQLAQQLWAEGSIGSTQPHWRVADAGHLRWPAGYFAAVCALGYTDALFLRQMRSALRPGGLLAHEGFAERQREQSPQLPLAWTMNRRKWRTWFPGWELLWESETDSPPFLLRTALRRPLRC